ncbi:hypothetical protein LR48_Vigan04g152800 [Vigna angularis]|uniref:Protein kinase domain-containing protein n=1 Tax=Phaseolus angularis TaxID=3914 RepID=A0A0L9UEH1_PHAAN|nr:hypothetical protein LR48_Vigan04g152800 [Vigna angularis]
MAGCQTSCHGNCSCLAMFFHRSSGNGFFLDSVGSFQKPASDPGYVSYIKVSSEGGSGSGFGGGGSGNKHTVVVVIIVLVTFFVICGLVFWGVRYQGRKQRVPESPSDGSEEANFLENLTGMPIHYNYKDLETTTNNFSVKLGQGGLGSVYKGVLADGTQILVKKLEIIGQGKKEFRAEVSIIGSIHHLHLVRLKGFCADGSHRLLAYEFNIALGTTKDLLICTKIVTRRLFIVASNQKMFFWTNTSWKRWYEWFYERPENADQHIFICLKHSASSGVWDDEVAGEADGVVVQMGIAEKLQRARG